MTMYDNLMWDQAYIEIMDDEELNACSDCIREVFNALQRKGYYISE